MTYYVYIIQCCDDSLYTGITNDIGKRMAAHRQGEGSKYVRSRLPFKLIYQEEFTNRSEASIREAEIKKWDREKKVQNLKLVL